MRSAWLLVASLVAAALAPHPARAQCTPNPALEFRLIARAASSGEGSVVFVNLDQRPAVDDDGRVVFAAEARIDFLPRQGVFSGLGGPVTILDTDAAFPPRFGSPDIEAGQVAYRRGGVWLVRDADGTTTRIAVGDPVGGRTLGGGLDPRVSADGTIAFQASVKLQPNDLFGNPAIVRVTGSGVASIVALTGQGGGMSQITGDAPVVADDGEVLLRGIPLGLGQDAILWSTGDVVAQTGPIFHALGQGDVNVHGDLVFAAVYTAPGGRALVLPDLGAIGFSCNGISGFDTPAIADDGTVVALGVPNRDDVYGQCGTNPPETGPWGLYRLDAAGGIERIVGVGDCLFDHVVTSLGFAPKGLARASRDVTFWASLDDASQVIVRAGAPRPNASPGVTPTADRTSAEGAALTVPVVATDPEGDALRYHLVAAPSAASLDAAGVLRWTPSELDGPGVYDVTVGVDDGPGRPVVEDQFTITVEEVNRPPEVAFTLDAATVPLGAAVTLTDTTADHDWPPNPLVATVDWGDGAPAEALVGGTASHVYAQRGGYLVTLAVDDGHGAVSASRALQVVAPPVAGFLLTPASPLPLGRVVVLDSLASDPDDDVSYEVVDWGDGSPPDYFVGQVEHTYLGAGEVTIVHTVVDGAGLEGRASERVSVANTAPVAAFDLVPEAVAVGLEVALVDDTHDAEDNLSPFDTVVDWGDGRSDLVMDGPVHRYAHAGVYEVVVRAVDLGGLDSVATRPLEVFNRSPVADFSLGAGPFAALDVVPLTDLSTDVDGNLDVVHVDWGDGAGECVYGNCEATCPECGELPPAQGAGPSGAVADHAYDQDGSYAVRVTATDLAGVSHTRERVVIVGADTRPPHAELSLEADGWLVGRVVTVTDLSLAGAAPITLIKVAWGDGATGEVPLHGTAEHTYTRPGAYTLEYDVEDAAGRSDTVTTQVTIVNRPPRAEVVPVALARVGEVVEVVDLSGDPDGAEDLAAVTVDWGDGATTDAVPGVSLVHSYGATGTFEVVVTVRDRAGAEDVVVFTITVSPAPTGPHAELSLEADGWLVGRTVTVTDLSLAGAAPIARVTVVWGDGATGEVTPRGTATHAYSRPGTYALTYQVVDAAGRSDTVTTQVTIVNRPPRAEVVPVALARVGEVVEVVDLSGDPDGAEDLAAVTVDWGDGATTDTAPGESLVHSYGATGTFEVVVTVRDRAGAEDVVVFTITVSPAPTGPHAELSLEADGWLVGRTVTVTDLSLAGAAPIARVTVVWGDGATGEVTPRGTATHAYSRPGTYALTYQVVDAAGRSDTVTTQVTIVNRPPRAEVVPVALARVGEVVEVVDLSGDPDGAEDLAAVTVDWGDGATTDTAPGESLVHSYGATGTFEVVVTVRDRAGAEDVVVFTITVSPAPTGPHAELSLEADGWLVGRTVTVTDLSLAGAAPIVRVTVAWGDGATSEVTPRGAVGHMYKLPGAYRLELVATDAAGRVDRVATDVTIVNRPPQAKLPALGALQVGDTARARDASSDPDGPGDLLHARLDWGDGTTSAIVAPNATHEHVYTRSGSYRVRLSIVDRAGASSEASADVVVTGRPPVAALQVSPRLARRGQPVRVTDRSVDPDGPADLAGATVDWGDGSPTSELAPGTSASHRYLRAGHYTIVLRARDHGRAQSAARAEVVVVSSGLP